MRLLRKTIQNLIIEMWSESNDPYKEYSNWEENHKRHVKLMKLIQTGDPESINQALELSEAMEYISGFSYKEEKYDGYSGKKTYRYYELYAPFDEDFLQTMRSTQKYGGKYFEMTEPDDEVVVLMFVEKIK